MRPTDRNAFFFFSFLFSRVTSHSHGTAVKLRSPVKQALDDGVYFNACAFADKLVTLSAGLPEDVLLLARCHVAQGDYRQALEAPLCQMRHT